MNAPSPALADIAARYGQNVAAAPNAAAAPPPPPAVAAPLPPAGHYLASDNKYYPIPAGYYQDAATGQLVQQAAPAPAPVVQQAPPAPAAPALAAPQPLPPLSGGQAIPPLAAAAAAATHLAQALPINPPEVVQALDPNAPAPVERKRRGPNKAKAAASATPNTMVAQQSAATAAAESIDSGCQMDPVLREALNEAAAEDLTEVLVSRGWQVRLIRRAVR